MILYVQGFHSSSASFDNISFSSAAYRSMLRSSNSLHGPSKRSKAWMSSTPLKFNFGDLKIDQKTYHVVGPSAYTVAARGLSVIRASSPK